MDAFCSENTPYRVQWRPRAREDLRAIIRHIGENHPIRAQSFGKTLRDKTLVLAQYPNLGRTGRPDLPAFVRELVVHPHYTVLYRVWKDSKIV